MTKTTRQTMQAIVQTEEKVTASLELQEVPVPTLKPGEVLVEVKAAGVNRADLFCRRREIILCRRGLRRFSGWNVRV